MELRIKYRPKDFSTFVGNKGTVSSLQRLLKKRETFPHALLFTGIAGGGKTTLARIVARQLGCNRVDFSEIDSVDMSGVDIVREKRKQSYYKPRKGKVSVYFFDECHRLSKTAQDNLLKMLEEPPAHAYFILATTEPTKLISTVRSRCTTFEVSPLEEKEIVDNLLNPICIAEGYPELPKEIGEIIARDCCGSCRNALVYLNQIIGMEEKEMEEALQNVVDAENEGIELCRVLYKKGSQAEARKILKNLTGDPETIRRIILGYGRTVFLNSGDGFACFIMDCFSHNYYDTGKAGLCLSVASVYNPK